MRDDGRAQTPDMAIEVSAQMPKKIAALKAHASQVGEFEFEHDLGSARDSAKEFPDHGEVCRDLPVLQTGVTGGRNIASGAFANSASTLPCHSECSCRRTAPSRQEHRLGVRTRSLASFSQQPAGEESRVPIQPARSPPLTTGVISSAVERSQPALPPTNDACTQALVATSPPRGRQRRDLSTALEMTREGGRQGRNRRAFGRHERDSEPAGSESRSLYPQAQLTTARLRRTQVMRPSPTELTAD